MHSFVGSVSVVRFISQQWAWLTVELTSVVENNTNRNLSNNVSDVEQNRSDETADDPHLSQQNRVLWQETGNLKLLVSDFGFLRLQTSIELATNLSKLMNFAYRSILPHDSQQTHTTDPT